MTRPEYLAVCSTLRTANFSRSPGLRRRLTLAVLHHHQVPIAIVLAMWTAVLWSAT